MSKNKTVKNIFKKISKFLSAIIVPIFIIVGTVLIIYYAKGYRFALEETIVVEKTGVISIESSPSRASLYINGESKGQTSKTVGSLPEDIYLTKLIKDDYITWQKYLPVRAEKSTPYFAHLFLQNPKEENAYSTLDKEEVIQYEFSENENNLFLITKDQTNQTDTDVNKPNTLLTYNFFKYKINRNFWDFNNNPIKFFIEEIPKNSNFKTYISPNGSYIILELISQTNNEKRSTYTLINTASSVNNSSEIDLSQFSNEIKIEWAYDNQNLIITEIIPNKDTEEDNEIDNNIVNKKIFSYNISTENTTQLLPNASSLNETQEKSEDIYIWRTDQNGFFYHLRYIPAQEESANQNPYYQIIQKPLSGEDETAIIKSIYYQTNRKPLDDIINKMGSKESTEIADFIPPINDKIRYTEPFKNSPECGICIGEVVDFEIQQEEEGITIKTSQALYWYDIESKKYQIISPFASAKFLHFSPDQNNLLFFETPSLKVFTLNKKESDHVTKIGVGNLIKNIDNELSKNNEDYSIGYLRDSFKWMNNSTYIYYRTITQQEDTENELMSIKYLDIDGENKNTLYNIDLSNYKDIPIYTIDPKLENIYFASTEMLREEETNEGVTEEPEPDDQETNDTQTVEERLEKLRLQMVEIH